MTARKAFGVLALIGCAAIARAQPASSDPLAPLRFLIGEWRAIDNTPGESGGFAFTLSVQNHVMTRTNYAVYEANATHPASRHDDLMVIYAEGGALKALYFDNEGHVIHYDVSSRRDREVVFHAAPTAGDPGYRLSYVLMPEGLLKGQFEVSPPGDREAFKPYLTWTARRAR
jgi:hypothetical protein